MKYYVSYHGASEARRYFCLLWRTASHLSSSHRLYAKQPLLENGTILVTETFLFEPVFVQIKTKWPSEIYMLFYVNIGHKLHFVKEKYEVVSIPIAAKKK